MLKGILSRLARKIRRGVEDKLGIAFSIGVWYQVQVHDNEGNIVSDTGPRRSHSFLFQFLQILYTVIYAAGDIAGGKDTGGTASTVDFSALVNNYVMACNAGAASAYGIVVGTGVGVEDNMNYALGTAIAHGVGAGQLQYEAHAWTAPAVVGANVDFEMRRTFTNGSGGSITVEEIAVYARTKKVTSVSTLFCILRDLTGGVAVADTYTLSVKYTLRTTV